MGLDLCGSAHLALFCDSYPFWGGWACRKETLGGLSFKRGRLLSIRTTELNLGLPEEPGFQGGEIQI